MGWVPDSGRPPGEGNGNPLQYSCLENPMNSGTWMATVHGVAKSQSGLEWLSIQEHIIYCYVANQYEAYRLHSEHLMIVHSFCMWEHLSGVGVAQGLLSLKPQEGSFRAGLAGFQTPSPSWWRGPRSLPSGPLHGFAFLRTPSETERVEWSPGPFIPLL